jgi:hypothetical protein
VGLLRTVYRSFHCTLAAFCVMFDDPVITVFTILFRFVCGAGTLESNRYILVCSTPLPRQPKEHRCAKLGRGLPRLNTFDFSFETSRYQAGSVDELRWLFISTCTLTQRLAAATRALATGVSVREYSEIRIRETDTARHGAVVL